MPPPDRLLVAESGISGRADVERLAPHADAFLVGSSLMKADDPATAARALAFGRVKVCGLTDAHDIAIAAEAGASYAGIIMVPHTPRAVGPARARLLAETSARAGIPLVGVFRNETTQRVVTSAHAFGMSAVQLHGSEDEDYIAALKPLLPGSCEIWVARGVGREVDEKREGADRTLFDTAVNGHSGGTGRTFDWSRIANREDLASGILAGGLNPHNARAASRVGAFALDVGSGVEMAPGRKDSSKLFAFFEALRAPKRGEVPSC